MTKIVTKEVPHSKAICSIKIQGYLIAMMESDKKGVRAHLATAIINELKHLE